MPRNEFHQLEKEELIDLLIITRNAMEKKNDQLKKTRVRLSSAKKRLQRMKDIIQYQRERILGLPMTLSNSERWELAVNSKTATSGDSRGFGPKTVR